MKTLFRSIVFSLFILLAGQSNATVILEDTQFNSNDWTNYGSGEVSRSSDHVKVGIRSLKKSSHNDPNGGYRLFNTAIGREFIFEGWLFRPSSSTGGAQDRLAISNSDFDGYGFRITGNQIVIERRNAGSGTDISNSISWNRPSDTWYRFKFVANTDNTFTLEVFNQDASVAATVTSNADNNITSFDRVVVHGGNTFYIDDINIRLRTQSNALDIAQLPLFLSTSVPPNLMFVIDDSGSMKWSHIPDSIVGVCQNNTNQTNRALGRSNDYNKMYFDPNATYQPPLKADGTRYSNSSFTSAWTDGYQQTGDVNLSNSYRATWRYPWTTGSEAYCGGTGAADYYTYDETCSGGLADTSCYTRHVVSATEQQNFANWYSYYRTRVLSARAGIGDAFNNLPSDFRLGWGRINQDSTTVDGSSQRAVNQGVRSLTTNHKSSFYAWLHNSPDTGSTPLRRALQGAGDYFTNTTATGPYSTTPGEAGGDLLSCRQNFTILMSDGYWNGSSPSVGNVDDAMDAPFEDAWSNTLADVAAKYWKTDLADGLTNNVPKNDRNPANWQHMVTYTVGLGVFGDINPDTAFNAIDTETAIAWGNPTSDDAHKIDDMLHAAVNARGGFFSAADPSSFATELESVLLDIIARTSSSATAVATTSFFLSDTSRLFQASFDSNGWSGNLTAFKPEIDINGQLTVEEIWNAASLLPAYSLRTIFSHDGSGNGISKGNLFTWGTGGLSLAQKSQLNNNEDLLNYIRGANIAGMRPRGGNIMGDIINSDPIFSHSEHFGYHSMGAAVTESSTYNTFVTNKSTRPQMIYVGANAGMLHAFDATTGIEKFAYVPSNIIEKLPQLADLDYDHRYYVDGKIHISDAYINGQWKTILIGTTGAGGRSIFALDISDPNNFSASNVLWEFTHPQLGNTFGEPVIGRLKNGDWAVFASNGYNSEQQKAQLFVINLQTGLLERTLDTGIGTLATPNGLASPAILYGSEDGNTFISTVYAGDLQGHLWKFDLDDTDSDQWSVANSGDPIFTATHNTLPQPITVRPELKRHPAGGMMVLFGTGSFFKEQDPLDLSVQTVYGIRDNGQTVVKSDLVEQEISYRGSSSFNYEVTAITAKSVDYKTKGGWFLNLIYNNTAEGERLVTNPQIWFNRLRLSTTIPNIDPCEPGATSWALEIDYLTGGRLQYSIYDLDNDGAMDTDDSVTVDGVTIPVSGIKLDQAGALPAQFTEHLIINPEDDEALGYRSDLEDVVGRQTWREVR